MGGHQEAAIGGTAATATAWAIAAATLLAVVALLVAQRLPGRAGRIGLWLTKPLASAGFVALALELGALRTPYGRILLVALALGWLGDVLLIPSGNGRAFTAGLVSFLLGHLALAAAFVLRGVALPWLAAGMLAAGAGGWVALRWLAPHVPADLRVGVRAYVAVIAAMVAAALGTFGAAGGTALLAGAVAFFASDLSVARERFVAPAYANALWGLPLYYGAQLLLASTV